MGPTIFHRPKDERNSFIPICALLCSRMENIMNERSETYELISKLAYLLGVNKSIFENEHLSPMMEWYDKLNQVKEARVVRSLCKIRTALMRNYKNVDVEMKFNLKNLESLPYFSVEDIKQLRAWGIEVIHVNYKTNKYIIDMNRLIQRYIDDCRNLFPMWLKWQYIRDIFIMPQGTSEGKVKSEWGVFTNNVDCYRYLFYMRWRAY